MRNRWSRIAGVVALVATLGTAAAAFQIDPEVVTQVSTPPTGLWVPAPSTGDVVRVDAASGGVTARVRVGDPGAEFVIAERDNGVVVVDRTGGRVSLVDPALHVVTREIGTVPTSESLIDIGPETIVVATGTRVDLIDPDLTTSTSSTVFEGVRSIAAAGTGAVGSTGTDRFDIDNDGAVDPNGDMDGMVVRVGDRVVVAAENAVRELNGGHISCFEGDVGTPSHLIATPERWVVAIVGSVVHVSDLDNGECVGVDLGSVGTLGRPVAAAGKIYVPERATGVVHIVTPSEGTAVAHPILGGGSDLRIRARDGFVVAYDATSPVAALLDGDGFVRWIDTSIDHRGITAVLGDEGSAALVGSEGDDPVGQGESTEGLTTDQTAEATDPDVLAATLQNPVDVEDSLPTDELIANFAFSATTVLVNELVRFVDSSTGSPEAWSWDFGDGSGAEGPEVDKAWEAPGTYPVTLRVTRGEISDEISLSVTVVPEEVALPPAADFQLSASVVNVGKPIFFEDRSDGDIERWRWDFGDGTSATSADASKVWDAPGRYTVTLTVANSLGSDSASVFVEVIANLRPPIAVLTVEETEVDLGLPVAFSAVSTTDPAKFTWDFGDGRTSTGAEVIHVFLEEGTFTVTLTAENDAGVAVQTVEMTVAPPTLPPQAIIGSLPPLIEAGDAVSLNSLSTNSPDTIEWSFGDGESASGESVSHTWDAEGTYVVTLTAENDAGSDTETLLIEILAELPPPIAQIAEFPASPWVGDATLFLDGSLYATTWSWDFGDGVTSSARDPLHTFTSAGQKIVTLTVTNRNGTDSASVLVEPRLEPTASFFPSATGVRAGEMVAFTDASVNATSWFWDFGDGEISGNQNPSHIYADPGSYGVSLTVESATGDSDTTGPVIINVDPAPPKLEGIQKIPVDSGTLTTLVADTFEAQVAADSGPIDRYRIDFGDGNGNEGVTAPFAHTYSSAGTYLVRMQARGPLGDWSDWVSRSFTVVDPPPPSVAIADSVPATAEVGNVALAGVQLGGSGPIATWRWEITRGGSLWPLSGQSPTHDFEAAGDYTITLIAESPVAAVADAVVSRQITITVPPPPQIQSIAANPEPATTGVVVSFTPDVIGSVSTWEWDYEGDGYIAGPEQSSHVFNLPGTYEVKLRVTGPFSQQDEDSVFVVVNPQPTPSSPVASPSSPVLTGTTVSLSSTELNGLTGLTWDWEISNGVTTTSYLNAGQTISHNFDTAGSWTVTVTATDGLNISGSAVSLMTVEDPVPPLVAGFTHTVAGPLQIQFADASTGPAIVSWSWDFGDPGAVGDTAAQNPLVTFSAPGSYSVTLTVRSADEQDTTVVLVTVA